ncbi:MAG: hypothetical protein JWR69_3756, partial [Pedosphaera sp.]|nr:hypothetical protein [Pedosphaera sp.]
MNSGIFYQSAAASRRAKRDGRRCGALSTELIVAMAILVIAAMPLALSFAQEGKVLRQSYQKAAAMELVDGEMEILLA